MNILTGVVCSSHLEEVVLTLMSENSKAYKISIRECKYCGVGFCSGYALNEHYNSCGSKPVMDKDMENTVDCTVCNVKFPTHGDLTQHNQYHQGTHKYLCRFCNRSYQSNPGRLKHEQLEHGSQPLLHCEACGKQFKRKDRLKDHMATKHSIATPHKCPYCDSAFKLRDYLRKHVNQSHPGQLLGSSVLKAEEQLTAVVIHAGERVEERMIEDSQVEEVIGQVVEDVEINENNVDLSHHTIHVVVKQSIDE